MNLMIIFSTRNAINPSSFTAIHQLIQLSIDHHSLKLTQQSHALISHLGLHQHTVTITKLIQAYSHSNNNNNNPLESQLLFDSIPVKDVYLWNTLINGFAKRKLYKECFRRFNLMCGSHYSPDEFTFTTLAKVSGDSGDLTAGESIHAMCIKSGFVADSLLSNSLMSMYDRCDRYMECRQLFDEMSLRNTASWNAIISGYTHSGVNFCIEELFKLFKNMQEEGLNPSEFTISSVLPFCGKKFGMWDYGRELHCLVIKNELDLGVGSDVYLGSCLIDMYSRSERVDVSRRVFDLMRLRNVYAWNSMINGYVQSGDLNEAIHLFRMMQGRGGAEPNEVSLLSILPSCRSLAGLRSSKEIHGFAVRKELNNEISLFNSLIDVYSHCGSLSYAKRVFEHVCIHKTAISWSSMICGYGFHGKGDEAVSLYKKMLKHGIKPDAITSVGALSACCKSGLVKEGLDIYNTSLNQYGIKPTMEICSCMVDLLGRSGQFDEALSFIKAMPLVPGPSVWGALVNASKLHGNHEMLDFAYQYLVQTEPENPSNYISLSNLYATSQKWDLVAEMRKRMKGRGLRKLPGCSWISIKSETHSFFVADKVHPKSDMIYEMLNELILVMNEEMYSPEGEF